MKTDNLASLLLLCIERRRRAGGAADGRQSQPSESERAKQLSEWHCRAGPAPQRCGDSSRRPRPSALPSCPGRLYCNCLTG